MSPFTYSSLLVSACVPPTDSVPVISVLPDDADTTNMSLVPSLIFRSPFRVASELVRPIRSAAPFTPIEFPMKRMSSTSTYPKSLEIFRAPAVPAVCVRKALVAGSFTVLLRVVTPDTSRVSDSVVAPPPQGWRWPRCHRSHTALCWCRHACRPRKESRSSRCCP